MQQGNIFFAEKKSPLDNAQYIGGDMFVINVLNEISVYVLVSA